MIAIHRVIESLLHEKIRRGPLLLQLNLHALLQLVQLVLRKGGIEQDIGGEAEPLADVVAQAGCGQIGDIRTLGRLGVDGGAQLLGLFGDLLA